MGSSGGSDRDRDITSSEGRQDDQFAIASADPRPAGRHLSLRGWLVLTDVLMLLLAWSVAPLAPWIVATPQVWWLMVPLLTIWTVVLLAAGGLYRARVCAVRTSEMERLALVSVLVALLGLWAVPLVAPGELSANVATGAAVGFVALGAGRALYRNWLLAQRAMGNRLREVVIIGADDEASRLGSHLAERPEVGYEVLGYFRSITGHAAHVARPILGQVADVPAALSTGRITGAIVVPGALQAAECDMVLAALHDAQVHVHLATGLRGIDSRRLRSLPMGREPLLYLEPAGARSPWYDRAQRLLDVVGATVALAIAAPFVVVAAISIKLTDKGPVLFRQERAGKGNRPFTLFKLRSMTVNAEAQLGELLQHNERDGGPLFKLHCDPRVTKVGRLLRATSLDEVPQLVNVLRGEMSLVGPRPALLDEVAEFDDQLMVRQQVRPGVTGLWQVEGRHDPSFSAYRYLDVFYVENQSMALDLTILMATVRAVFTSARRSLRASRPVVDTHPSAHVADDEDVEVSTPASAALSPSRVAAS